jgi:hypothetical protein
MPEWHTPRFSDAVAPGRESTVGDVHALAQYLSTLDLAGCDVLVIDPSPRSRIIG